MTKKKYKRLSAIQHQLADGQFHSGQSLSETHQASRSAIWQDIQALMARGIAIQSVKGKGYRIPGGLSLLCAQRIQSQLSPWVAEQVSQVTCLETVDSTNDYLSRHPDRQQFKHHACFAEQQTAGRGRRPGRQWCSPYANNIYHSLLWHIDRDSTQLMGFSLAIGVLVAETLQKIGVHKGISLKWPNDILWHGKKIAGILIELFATPHQHTAAIIGVGINTHMDTPTDIDTPIATLSAILGHRIDRNHLAATLLNTLVPGIAQFSEHGLSPFLARWDALDAFAQHTVILSSATDTICGRYLGITETGALRIETAPGVIRNCLIGELSLKGLQQPE